MPNPQADAKALLRLRQRREETVPRPRDTDMRKPNIVIIVLDALREDHAQDLDRLVDYSFVKYQNAIAPASWTLHHTSPYSQTYTPSEHGIHETKGLRKKD